MVKGSLTFARNDASNHEDTMDTSRLRETVHASRSAAADLMMAVLRLARTIAVTALVSAGVLLLASAFLYDTPDLAVFGVGMALLLPSVLLLPASTKER
jgi:hypothetical protein